MVWRCWDQEAVDFTGAPEAIDAGEMRYIYEYGNDDEENEGEGISYTSSPLASVPHYNISNETSIKQILKTLPEMFV